MLSETIDKYLKICNCNGKELSEKSGISRSNISRMKNNPEFSITESQARALAKAFCSMNEELDFSNLYSELTESNKNLSYTYETFVQNLNDLMKDLDINAAELARDIKYDPSYLSRIRTGKRKPSDIGGLSLKIENFVRKRCRESEYSAFTDENGSISGWLTVKKTDNRNYTYDFIKKIDDFNLDEYIKTIHFDEINIKELPFNFPGSKKYSGLDEIKKAELDFFKAAVLSKDTSKVFMHSEMPMEKMSEDHDFDKKWMMGLALMIKKGVKIDIIHHLDRPWKELMLGLEAWIPIYMTGLVSPYYIKEWQPGLFSHLNYSSDVCALKGECLRDRQDTSFYYLTRNKNEVEKCRKNNDILLSRATPLMEIFSEDEKVEKILSQEGEEYFEPGSVGNTFKNIRIRVCEGKWALVSKISNPHIHFLIRHPILVSAIGNFEPQYSETD